MAGIQCAEFNRLMGLLDASPAPTPWGWEKFPPLSGPDGKALVWKRDQHTVQLVEKQDENMVYLGLAFYCYVMRIRENNLLVWYHLGPVGSPYMVRFRLFDTRSLSSVQKMPLYNNLVHEESSQISYNGPQISLDLPIGMARGLQQVNFPEEMRIIEEVHLVAPGSDRTPKHPVPGFPGESVYILRPAKGQVEVVPLDWWNDGDFDFMYQWIARIARDPKTGKLVGDGVRISPFLMDPHTGRFEGWMHPWLVRP